MTVSKFLFLKVLMGLILKEKKNTFIAYLFSVFFFFFLVVVVLFFKA